MSGRDQPLVLVAKWMCTLLGVLLLYPSAVFAWGHEGHRIVAEIAEEHLSPHAKREVEALLRLDDAQSCRYCNVGG